MMNKLYTLLLVSLCMQLSAEQTKEKTYSKDKEKTKQCAHKNDANKKSSPKKVKVSKRDQKKQENWKSFLKSCSTSISTGTLAGILSGQAFAYTARHQCDYQNKYVKNISKILAWFLWSAVRQTSLDMIEEEMDEYNIKHNTTLMTVSGFCADWLSACYAFLKWGN